MNPSKLPVAALFLAAVVGCRDDVPSATELATVLAGLRDESRAHAGR